MREIPSGEVLMEAYQYANYWRELVDPQLQYFFEKEISNPYCGRGYGEEIVEKIADLTLRGGKRQRVAFVAATTSMLGLSTEDKEVRQVVVDSAMAVEILQTHLLIHDDIIDKAPLRRGGATIHELYSRWLVEGEHEHDPRKYGNDMALLAGDLAIYYACQPVLKSDSLSPEKKVRILDILVQSGIDTFYGQVLDLERDVRGTTTEEEILELAFVKAGRSSGEVPMHIGAVLAGKDDPGVFQRLSEYATPVSIAAQLHDDILGLFGDEHILGKSSLSDLQEGKQTLLILKADELAVNGDKATLMASVGKEDITEQEADEVKRIVTETGALDYVRLVARRYIDQAQQAMRNWDQEWGSKERDFFWIVSEASIARAY